MRKSKKYSASKHAIIAWMIAVCCVQPGMAGTQGSYMNSRGDGVAVDTIKFVTRREGVDVDGDQPLHAG